MLHYFFVTLFPLPSVSGYNLGAALNTSSGLTQAGLYAACRGLTRDYEGGRFFFFFFFGGGAFFIRDLPMNRTLLEL